MKRSRRDLQKTSDRYNARSADYPSTMGTLVALRALDRLSIALMKQEGVREDAGSVGPYIWLLTTPRSMSST